MKTYSGHEHVNVGSGEDITILELTKLVCDVVGYKGEIVHDLSKPDGTPRKLMSADKIRGLGWTPSIALEDGVAGAYRWFLDHIDSARGVEKGSDPAPPWTRPGKSTRLGRTGDQTHMTETKPLYAARLNAFKIGAAEVWPGRNRITTLDLLERAASVPGMNAADLNFPDHLDGFSPAEMKARMEDLGIALNGFAMRYLHRSRFQARRLHPSRSARPPRRHRHHPAGHRQRSPRWAAT